jgi:hypothetical protein
MRRTTLLLGVATIVLTACSSSTVDAAPTPTTPVTVVTASPTVLPPGSIADGSGDVLLPVDYLDATSAAVSRQDGVFVFTSTLVEPIPASFEPPTPWDAILWSFCIDTDLSTMPRGYPFTKPTPVPCEFIVTAASEGGAMTGTLIDRRPLLDGKDAATPSIPITVDGTRVSASVSAEQLGSPKRFTWVMAMTVLSLPWPNNDFLDVDEVPDSSFSDPAPWPPVA